jgi:hypothetical protein
MVDESLVRRAQSRSRQLLKFHRSGTFELPPRLLAVAEGLERAESWLAQAKRREGAAHDNVISVERDLARSVADAALADRKAPRVEVVLKARAAREKGEVEVGFMAQGVELAANDFLVVASDEAEEVVRSLRPAYEKLKGAARPLAEVVDGIESNSGITTPEQFAAWRDLEGHVATYGVLRETYEAFIRLGDLEPESDEAGYYAELMDADQHRARVPGGPSPLPSDPVARFVYVTLHASPWFPLGEERDQMWRQRLEQTGELERRRAWKEQAERWAAYRT